MSPNLQTTELRRALAEWRRLTTLEGQAIQTGDWQQVADHQARKSQLQADIQHALDLPRATPFASPQVHGQTETEADSAVRELIALEQRNADLLAQKRSRHQAESACLTRTLRDLGGVRRAYCVNRGAHWHSYS